MSKKKSIKIFIHAMTKRTLLMIADKTGSNLAHQLRKLFKHTAI